MTEQKAIEILNGIDEVHGNLPEDGDEVELTLMMAKDALKKIQQYLVLGTVEELQEAMEKQRAKKPVIERCWGPILCPTCGKRISNVEGGSYCQNCGQAIDWSEEN